MHSCYRTVTTLIILLLATAIIAAPAAAVKVEGAKIMLDVEPGTTYLFPMAVSTKATDSPADYAIDVLGFGQSPDAGSYQGLEASADASPYSARSFVSVEQSLVHLDPGERVAFNAVLEVPANAGDGGRYAIILIHPAETGGAQASFATAVAVPVMLTVTGSSLVETGEIGEVSVGEVVAGKPIMVATDLTNTGNHHYYGAVNALSVTDGAGNVVATATSEPFSRAVIPTQTVRFETPLTTGLPVGTYTVTSRMTLEDGTLLDEASATFAVEEEYIPPFTEASITVTPENEAVLRVPEGTVQITFPQGAVLGDSEITVAPYPGTLPALPAGVAAGTTAFTVEGLSGLLAKDATLRVTYSADDLKAAGGDAGKLLLARWDRGDGQWTLLPTTVDAGAMTLSATTNRFSTWAVVATEQAPAGASQEAGLPGWIAIGAVATAFTLVAMRPRRE